MLGWCHTQCTAGGKALILGNILGLATCLVCAGNSKTLSFKLAADRLRGSSSSSKLFRLFHAIDLFHYQCSEQSTSQVSLLFWILHTIVHFVLRHLLFSTRPPSSLQPPQCYCATLLVQQGIKACLGLSIAVPVDKAVCHCRKLVPSVPGLWRGRPGILSCSSRALPPCCLTKAVCQG